MRAFFGGLALALTIVMPISGSAALAQKNKPAFQAGQDFSYPSSGIIAKGKIGGMTLVDVKTIIPGADYGVTYRSDKKEDTLGSLYISRNTVGDASMWFHWVSRVIDMAGYFGNFSQAPATSYTPPAHGVATGMMRAVKPEKGQSTSTGVAVFVHGDYVIKLRLTSQTLSPDANLDRMRVVLDGLQLPSDGVGRDRTAAYAVADCDSPIPTASKAMLVRADMTAGVMLGSVGMAPSLLTDLLFSTGGTGTQWCTDPNAENVYRPNGATDRWVMPQNDSYGILALGKYAQLDTKGYVIVSANPSQMRYFGFLDSTMDPESLSKTDMDVPLIAGSQMGEDGSPVITLPSSLAE